MTASDRPLSYETLRKAWDALTTPRPRCGSKERPHELTPYGFCFNCGQEGLG